MLFILPDRRVARGFGEAEKQRDASGEKAWMAAIGLYKFLSCLKRDSKWGKKRGGKEPQKRQIKQKGGFSADTDM